MKKTLVVILCFLMGTAGLYAQNEIDALRYSRLNPSGTARYMGLGGAFSALGADFSTLSHNPAGIGLYKKSEVSITPSLYIGRTETTYFDKFSEDEKYNFNLGSVGIVMTTNTATRNPDAKWNLQFGFGLNRLANFNSHVVINGFNETSSYLTPYADQSQGLSLDELDDFGSGLAYDTELMYTNPQGNYIVDMPNGGVRQKKTMNTKGSINEMVFSVGGELNDKIYLGATVGVPYIKYNEHSSYTETDEENRNDYFDSFTRSDQLETNGTGVNLKLGIIVRATDWFRVGGAIETPTFYSLSDTYSTTFRSHFDTAQSLTSSADGFFEYQLTTPFKANAGVGFIIGKIGLVSADYEYLDYSNARLRSNDYDFETENDNIRTGYLKAHNIRLGTEWRLGLVSLRAGYGISANPYGYGTESVMSSYSAGLGLRGSKFFVDFAGVMNNMDDEYHLYDAPDNAAIADAKIKNYMFLVTLGLRY